jgi:histone deacetylase 6
MGQFPPDSGTIPSNGGIPNLIFSGDTSMRDTPDMTADIDARLKLETSEEDSEDSLITDTSSEPDDTIPTIARGLPISKLPTGLCYDERMRYHSEVSATSGENVHPEDPRRIYYIYKELCEAGLVDDPRIPPIVEVPLLRIDAREATREECLLVHTPDHYDFVKRTSSEFDHAQQLIWASHNTDVT